MGQTPQQPPQVGQVANGYQWNGVQWIPLGPPPQPAAEAVLVGEILRYAQAAGFTVQQSAHQLTLQRVVAERKTFLSTARLEYRATISLDDARRTARFTELLKESGSGLTSGGGEDGDFGTATGFGFQKSTYNSRTDGIAESIEEQAARLGTKYAPGFPSAEVKGQLGRLCAAAGYSFS